jgi:hypothetical protein
MKSSLLLNFHMLDLISRYTRVLCIIAHISSSEQIIFDLQLQYEIKATE